MKIQRITFTLVSFLISMQLSGSQPNLSTVEKASHESGQAAIDNWNPMTAAGMGAHPAQQPQNYFQLRLMLNRDAFLSTINQLPLLQAQILALPIHPADNLEDYNRQHALFKEQANRLINAYNEQVIIAHNERSLCLEFINKLLEPMQHAVQKQQLKAAIVTKIPDFITVPRDQILVSRQLFKIQALEMFDTFNSQLETHEREMKKFADQTALNEFGGRCLMALKSLLVGTEMDRKKISLKNQIAALIPKFMPQGKDDAPLKLTLFRKQARAMIGANRIKEILETIKLKKSFRQLQTFSHSTALTPSPTNNTLTVSAKSAFRQLKALAAEPAATATSSSSVSALGSKTLVRGGKRALVSLAPKK